MVEEPHATDLVHHVALSPGSASGSDFLAAFLGFESPEGVVVAVLVVELNKLELTLELLLVLFKSVRLPDAELSFGPAVSPPPALPGALDPVLLAELGSFIWLSLPNAKPPVSVF